MVGLGAIGMRYESQGAILWSNCSIQLEVVALGYVGFP